MGYARSDKLPAIREAPCCAADRLKPAEMPARLGRGYQVACRPSRVTDRVLRGCGRFGVWRDAEASRMALYPWILILEGQGQ